MKFGLERFERPGTGLQKSSSDDPLIASEIEPLKAPSLLRSFTKTSTKKGIRNFSRQYFLFNKIIIIRKFNIQHFPYI